MEGQARRTADESGAIPIPRLRDDAVVNGSGGCAGGEMWLESG